MAGYLEQLKKRQETAEAASPEPSEAAERQPEDPAESSESEAHATLLGDEVRELKEQLGAEREQRQRLEQRLEREQASRPSSLADVLRRKQSAKRRTWR